MKKQLNEVKKLQKIAGIIKENVNEAPRMAKTSALSKLVMDTGVIDEEFTEYLRNKNITFKVIQWNGPGGGNPEVEYYGDRAALEAMIDDMFDSGDPEQNEEYKTYIEPA